MSAAAACADAGGVAGGQSRLLRGAANPGACRLGDTSRAAAGAAAARPTSVGHRARRVRGAGCGFPWCFRPSPRAPRARPEGGVGGEFYWGISSTSLVSGQDQSRGVALGRSSGHRVARAGPAVRRAAPAGCATGAGAGRVAGGGRPAGARGGGARRGGSVRPRRRLQAGARSAAVAPRHGGRTAVGAVRARGCCWRRGCARATATARSNRGGCCASCTSASGSHRASWRAGSTRVRAG